VNCKSLAADELSLDAQLPSSIQSSLIYVPARVLRGDKSDLQVSLLKSKTKFLRARLSPPDPYQHPSTKLPTKKTPKKKLMGSHE
jgi:hypothetical protein